MNPASSVRFMSLWAINGPLDQTRLRRQLDQLKAAGLDGVVWHPRFYPNEPPYLGDRYLAEVSDVILYAKSLGLAFWIYDEDGWPSGTVGGQLLKKFPDDAQRWAELVTKKPERCLAEFKHAGKKWFLAERIGAGVNYFAPDLAQHFLQLTHERYRTGLKPAAWQHVEAVFCDEPEFGLGHAYASLSKHGAIPWTPRLPEIFHQRHGEDLLPLIPQLFFPGNEAAEVRVKFWELLTDIFNESFTAPINNWCKRHGKLFTAHLKGEEHPLFQVPTNGSCHQFFRHLSLPAIDALERYPANNFFPRQVSSAARQFGSGRCMVEAFGGAGWGATPEDLENYLLWLGRHGLTDFVLHLSQYRLDSAAMHDWPPSQPRHLTWRDAYPEVLRRVRTELQMMPRPAADTLVIAPNRGIMAHFEPREFLQTNVHNAAIYPESVAGKINRRFLERVENLHRCDVNYDIADERTVETFGKWTGKSLVVGACNYRHVIVDKGCQLNDSGKSLIKSFLQKTEIIIPTRIKRPHESATENTDFPVYIDWELAFHPRNSLLLEPVLNKDGWFTASFASRTPLPGAVMELIFADEVAEAYFNGKLLSPKKTEDGCVAKIRPSLLQRKNHLRFRAAISNELIPFVWVCGLFRLMSRKPFNAGPNHTIRTLGPFSLQPARNKVQRDLIKDGFPFLGKTLLLKGEICLPENATQLRIAGAITDAARLFVAGENWGWTWPAQDELIFDRKLDAGKHCLTLELAPNGFNLFGPHHYYQGDWHIISPDQIKGRRNFADPADAPMNTHIKPWHFRLFTLPDQLFFKPALRFQ